jgi:hypothetical protein
MDYRTLHMATYPTHNQSEDLLSDKRNLNQDSKKEPEFYHAISPRPLYEIEQTSMQDHSASPTHGTLTKIACCRNPTREPRKIRDPQQ